MLKLSVDNALGLCRSSFEQLGVPSDQAASAAECLAFASLRGIDSHGIQGWFAGYLTGIHSGEMKAVTKIKVIKDTPTIATVDGGGGLGPVIGVKCMEMAIAKAKKYGMGAVAAYNTNHYGAASFYSTRATAHTMIGVTCCNGTPRVVPFGGKVGLHGANPISVAIPGGEEGSIVLDMSTSLVAAGKLNKAFRDGKPIPLGWALDLDGKPTTDAKLGRQGYLTPMAGHKGYGLSLLVDVLAGAVTGALVGREIPRGETPPDAPSPVSSFFMAIQGGAFSSDEIFTGKVETLIKDAHSIPPAEGFDEVLVPGDLERRSEARRRAEGIPFTEAEWERIKDALSKAGLDADAMTTRFPPVTAG